MMEIENFTMVDVKSQFHMQTQLIRDLSEKIVELYTKTKLNANNIMALHKELKITQQKLESITNEPNKWNEKDVQRNSTEDRGF